MKVWKLGVAINCQYFFFRQGLFRKKYVSLEPTKDILYSVVNDRTDHVIGHVTDHVKKLILAIRGDTKTRDEIMNYLGLKYRGNLCDSYIKPAVSAGYVAMLYPDAVSRTDQAYYLTEKGLELLASLKKS